MTVVILANNDAGLYGFRKELLEALIAQQHRVIACVPSGRYGKRLKELGCEVVACDRLDRRGVNPLHEIGLLLFYRKILKILCPDIVFTYTIKPNIYGGWLCGKMHIPYVANVTGLGTAIENDGILHKISLILYRMGLKKAKKVFFQNQMNQEYMVKNKVVGDSYALLPGSGVNTEYFSPLEYDAHETINFLIIGRLMRDKGTDEVLEAARVIRQKYEYVKFTFIGYAEDEYYAEKIAEAVEKKIVIFDGEQDDVRPYLKSCDALIHASYHEGLSNVLLEAAACGRPVIATDVPGCVETYIVDESGISFQAKNTQSLIEAIQKFLNMSIEQRRTMGEIGREYVVRHFDRRIVVEAYLKELTM